MNGTSRMCDLKLPTHCCTTQLSLIAQESYKESYKSAPHSFIHSRHYEGNKHEKEKREEAFKKEMNRSH